LPCDFENHMNSKKFIIPNDLLTLSENMKDLLAFISNLSQSKNVFILEGEMGAGKTTLMVELGRYLKVIDPISSPTFSIVNEYECENGKMIYHFDLYRIEEEEELYDIGFEDYLNKKALVFIEWPDVGAAFLPEDMVKIKISQSIDSREITISY